MTKTGYTKMDISKQTLALFKQLEAEEAGQRGESCIEHDKFLRFLLLLYTQVRQDPVLKKIREKGEKL